MTHADAGIVIIADDLSGAADCGIACTAAGLRTLVVFGDRDDPFEAEAIAVDADTRGRDRDAAATETARLTRRFAAPGRLLFKKLDSTLRGHFAAELAATLAVMRETGPSVIVMAPAFPATGRTTLDGHQLLHGTKLEHTDIWKREAMTHRAHLPEILSRAGLRAAHLPLAAIRGDSLATALADASQEADAIVCDAETDMDLSTVATNSMILGPRTIWAGSAGLARHLPHAAGLVRTRPPAMAPVADGPILFVVGSVSPTSREQAARLQTDGTMVLSVAPDLRRAGPADLRWAQHDHRLHTALATGADLVLLLAAEEHVDLAEGPRLCHALARMVAPHAAKLGALVATGGETARALLQAFGIPGLLLIGEVEPGIPLSVTEGAHPLPVVTKAGAFGSPETLLHCRAVLRGSRSLLLGDAQP